MTRLDWIAARVRRARRRLVGSGAGSSATVLSLAGLSPGPCSARASRRTSSPTARGRPTRRSSGSRARSPARCSCSRPPRFAGSFTRGGLRLLPPLHAARHARRALAGAALGARARLGRRRGRAPAPAARDGARRGAEVGVIQRLNDIAPPRDVLHVELRPDRLRLPLDLEPGPLARGRRTLRREGGRRAMVRPWPAGGGADS